MSDDTPKIDEFGIISFVVTDDSGKRYRIEYQKQAQHMFITMLDSTGRAEGKKVIDVTKEENETIINTYKDYLKGKLDEE